MLITDCQNLEGKRILLSVINYANEEEVIVFIHRLAEQSVAYEILLSVTVNKWTEGKQEWFYEMLNASGMDIILCDYGRNLGYLNGTLAPYGLLRKNTTLNLSWVVVSNTDIEFASRNFFEILLTQTYEDNIGCIAPNVYVPTTGAYENPRYTKRFTKHEIQRRIKIFSSPFISNIYQRLGALKTHYMRSEEKKSQYVYLAHGCCFMLSTELADALCDIPYTALLYSEEAYVAEMAIQIGRRVYYDEKLKLYHHENAVTGKLRNSERSKMYSDSLSVIRKQFYEKGNETTYQTENVCAAIVSFNDARRIENNVLELCELNVTIVIIDNGSDAETVSVLEQLQEKYNITLLRNEKNMGIAFALQQGLDFAYKNRLPLYLTLDQDSEICDGMIQEMLRILNTDATIASIGPSRTIQNIPATQKKAKYVDYLITSGSITRTNIAVSMGGYDEEFFIDGVDFDFSLNLRKNGYRLAIASGAYLNHKIGEIRKLHMLFWNIPLSTHTPLRYYYMVRNHILLKKRYMKTFPGFFLKKDFFMTIECLKALVFFPEKKPYFSAIKRGKRDANEGKQGRYRDVF